jgi:hypothetical protein
MSVICLHLKTVKGHTGLFVICHIKRHVFTYTVGEKLAGEKVALGLRPCAGLVSGVCSSFLPSLF